MPLCGCLLAARMAMKTLAKQTAGQAVLVCRRDYDCGACVMGCTGGEACGGWHAPGATNLIKAAIKKLKGKEW